MTVTGKLVLVEWVDSARRSGWDDAKSVCAQAVADDLACESVGWLLADTDRYVLIAASLTDGGASVGDAIQIPRFAVTRIRRLSIAR